MSYEGYTQVLCLGGHYFERGADYLFIGQDRSCPHCGAAPLWSNEVDQTNCEEVGFISITDLKVKTPETSNICPTCHHGAAGEPATFHIPTWEETKELQQWYNPVARKWEYLKDRK